LTLSTVTAGPQVCKTQLAKKHAEQRKQKKPARGENSNAQIPAWKAIVLTKADFKRVLAREGARLQ
jgi:uncharacterized membrane protein YqiK